MREYRVFVSKPAEQDLEDIFFHIATRLLVPETANDVIDEFYEEMSGLKFMPKKHPLVDDIFLANLGYRTLPVKNYLIFYSVNESAGDVDIERILYARRDWLHIITGQKQIIF